MLNMTVRNTAKLIRAKSKSENVRLGRFFTKKETARLMANMLTLDESKTAYTVLDPGAGCKHGNKVESVEDYYKSEENVHRISFDIEIFIFVFER